jgi:DNA-binding CsgD family transcriptional regulator
VLDEASATLGIPVLNVGRDQDVAVARQVLGELWDKTLTAANLSGDPTGHLALLDHIRRAEEQLTAELLGAWDSVQERLPAALDMIRQPRSIESLLESVVGGMYTLGFDRAILSRVEDFTWLAERVHIGRDADWAKRILHAGNVEPQALDHTIVEGEMLRRKVGILVRDVQHRPGVHRRIAAASRSESYAAAPLIVDDEVIGFLHGDMYYQHRDPHDLDRRLLMVYSGAVSEAIGKLSVTEHLRGVNRMLRSVADTPPTPRLGPSARAVAPDPTGLLCPAQPGSVVTAAVLDAPVAGMGNTTLTRREVDVLKLLAGGDSNAAIARRLAISLGTVKTHVKSILRKLGAENRVEAAACWFEIEAARDRR